MNKLVLFANIKGGVGKSTLCVLFAHYLIGIGQSVQVLDADIQRSIDRRRKRDLREKPNVDIPWEVSSVFDFNRDGDMSDFMRDVKEQEGYVLVDCPGNTEAERLAPIMEAADAVVIPLSYAEEDLDATLNIYIPLLRGMNRKAKIIFIPNRINEKNQKDKEQLNKARNLAIEKLKTVGWVSARIKDCVSLESHRFNTIDKLNDFQKKAVMYPFNTIIEKI